MPELFETRGIRDDAEYWEALSARIAAEAARESSPSGLDWFGRSRVGWVAASLFVAAAVVFMMLPAARSPGIVRTDWAQALGPVDAVGQAIISDDRPPAIGALLLRESGGTK